MSRYIDADKVLDSLEQLRKSPWANDEHLTPMRLAVKESLDIVRDICIKDEPTADVKEVVHGEWIDKQLDWYKKIESRCSVCDWGGISDHDSYVDIFDFDFCPHCGADMRGEHNDI